MLKQARAWLGEKIISLGVRVLGEDVLAQMKQEHEEEVDQGSVPYPLVVANDRARGMVVNISDRQWLPAPAPVPVELPLKGSLRARTRR